MRGLCSLLIACGFLTGQALGADTGISAPDSIEPFAYLNSGGDPDHELFDK